MAIARNKQPSVRQVQRSKHAKDDESPKTETLTGEAEKRQALINAHLPPMLLTVTILVCSGFCFVFALRDFLSTGKNIGGLWDHAMLFFTKSTQWFDDSKGWKSQQGGFSAIRAVTTDANNMGGFFVRKLCGAAGLGVHLHKILPMLVHEAGAQWNRGHFRYTLWTSVVANLALVAFYRLYFWDDLKAAGATEWPMAMIAALVIETTVILYYLCFPDHKSTTSTTSQRGPAVALPPGKTHRSPVVNIVTRTTIICSTCVAVVAARDLFFPGQIIGIIPRDDIYLEWTNAFLHSPPSGSPEALDQGLEAPLYVGDKFVSQLCALQLLLLCLYKYVAALWIRYGSDAGGVPAARMMWKAAFFGNLAVTLCHRFFAHAAKSASYDLRWHLVLLSFETGILGLYAFF